MVEEAQEQKAPIERILNRYAKFYTPAALILGALVWWWSGDILRAITILIVFCPCVMVLATPTALVASVGNAALRGSLVKKGATIEAMAKVTAVAFDKTGTLTFGQPKLTTIQPLGNVTDASAPTEPDLMISFRKGVSPFKKALEHVQPGETMLLPSMGVMAFSSIPGIRQSSLLMGLALRP